MSAARATHHASAWWLVRDVGVVLALAAAAGALCGVLWEWWWTPPPGLVLDGAWYPDREGVRGTFSGTGLYAGIALVGGVVLGTLCAWVFDRMELVTLAAVAAGSVLAAWVMHSVGTLLAPPDPTAAARGSADYTELVGTLEVEGVGALLAFPAGALIGVAVIFIGLTPRGRFEE